MRLIPGNFSAGFETISSEWTSGRRTAAKRTACLVLWPISPSVWTYGEFSDSLKRCFPGNPYSPIWIPERSRGDHDVVNGSSRRRELRTEGLDAVRYVLWDATG